MNFRRFSIYIITNNNNTVLYTGVTSNLIGRIVAHKNKTYKGSFSARYNLCKLIYYENFNSINEAIFREKQIKKYKRIKKLNLILKDNPNWKDLFEEIMV